VENDTEKQCKEENFNTKVADEQINYIKAYNSENSDGDCQVDEIIV
jgi:hypothetical protein